MAIRRFLSNPLTSIAILALFSTAVLAIRSLECAVLCFLLATVFAILIGVRLRELIALLVYVIPLLIFYTAIAGIIQAVLLSYVDIDTLLLNIVRIEALIAMSIAIARSIDIVKLISSSRRISVRLMLAIALSLKMIRDFSNIWRTVRDTYSINLNMKSPAKKVLMYMLTVETFLMLSLYSVIQTAEAIITRPKLYAHRKIFGR